MLISRLGEFGLIERFRKAIKTDSSVIVGSGDDCAVLAFSEHKYQLFTCDMLVEGVDFTSNQKPYSIGRKAIAVQVSDIAACGGLPRHCLISIGLDKKTSVGFADRLFKGMKDFCNEFKINITGGDISRAPALVINVSMLGLVEKAHLCLRSNAKAGDIIFVTGELGGSISGKHLSFSPRLKEARYLVRSVKVNSMIDISDGLAQDLGHILKQSKVGALVFEELIPISKDARGLDDALFMGEDFELLFTVSRKEAGRLLKEKIFRPIGEITRNPGLVLIDKNSQEKPITPKGFQHF